MEPGVESSTRSWISGTWGQLRESGSNKVKSTYSPRKILSSRFLSRGRWRPKGVAAPCLRGAGVDVLGVGGLEKGSTDGEERLFITCSRDRRTVSCMAAIWASVNGPGCESVGALCGADNPNEAKSTLSSSRPSTDPSDEDWSLASSRTLSAFVGSAQRGRVAVILLLLIVRFCTRPEDGGWDGRGWTAAFKREIISALLPVTGRLAA